MIDYLEEYKRISNDFSIEMQRHEDVEGVMFLGGVARGSADRFSDIDIAVFSLDKLEWLHTGEQETEEGYDLEIFNIAINNGSDDWDEIKREAYQEGIVAYDRNGRVSAFLESALNYSKDYQIKKSAELIFSIAWHGWIYSPFRNENVKGYRWILNEGLWFSRGKECNVYYTTRYCIDLLIELLYAVNSRWTPDYKWRYVRSHDLTWLPANYHEYIDCLLFGEWSGNTWTDQKEKFQFLLDQTIAHIVPYMPDDWYAII